GLQSPSDLSLGRRSGGDGGRLARRHQAVVARIERPRALRIVAHVARPVGDDPAGVIAIPGVALSPGGAGEARLSLAIRRRLDLGADLDRRRAVRADMLERLADIGGLDLL